MHWQMGISYLKQVYIIHLSPKKFEDHENFGSPENVVNSSNLFKLISTPPLLHFLNLLLFFFNFLTELETEMGGKTLKNIVTHLDDDSLGKNDC